MIITGPFNEDEANYYIYANESRYTINKETGNFSELSIGGIIYRSDNQLPIQFTREAYLNEKGQCSKTMTIFLD